MNFLDASKEINGAQDLPRKELHLLQSSELGTLDTFLRALHIQKFKQDLTIRVPAFDTLAISLREETQPGAGDSCIVLLPWDLAQCLNWRTGIPPRTTEEIIRREAAETLEICKKREAPIVYLPAPLPPITGNQDEDLFIASLLKGMAIRAGGVVASRRVFSMTTYLRAGIPFSGNQCFALAESIMKAIKKPLPAAPAKVIATDLDNTLWNGIIGEDGLTGINYGNTGKGYKHFLYQSALRRLQEQGILLAAISRNSSELAEEPFTRGGMLLTTEDFVAIVANYGSKSVNLKTLARELNLDTDAFVFVDDNEVEIEEVKQAIPTARCLLFPRKDEDFPSFIEELFQHFQLEPGSAITDEDVNRTTMYRTRLAEMEILGSTGSDITDFLRDLDMNLNIHDRSLENRTRAIQLINKTNQFNIDGQRWSESDVEVELAKGAKLFTASLSDRHGEQGEILSCLIDAQGNVLAFVMSCRVFQRTVEHNFIAWLLAEGHDPKFRLVETQKNEPIRLFLDQPCFTSHENILQIDQKLYAEMFSKEKRLMCVKSDSPSIV